MRKKASDRVNVRMDDGTARSMTAAAPGDDAVGERVKVVGSALVGEWKCVGEFEVRQGAGKTVKTTDKRRAHTPP